MRVLSMVNALALWLCVSPLRAQTKGASSDEQALRKIEIDTARFEQQNNTAGFAKVLSDDWIVIAARPLSKKEFIQNVRDNGAAHEGGANPYTIEKKNLQVHLFGDTAVVTYVKQYRQTPDTSKGFEEDDTDVFTRDFSGWRLRFTKIAPVTTQSASD